MKCPRICQTYGWTCLSKLLRWVFRGIGKYKITCKLQGSIDSVAFVDCTRQMAICTGWSRVYVPIRPPCFSWNYKVNSILCYDTNLILSPPCHIPPSLLQENLVMHLEFWMTGMRLLVSCTVLSSIYNI